MKKVIALILVALLMGGVAFAATPGYRLNPGTGQIAHNGGGSQSDPGKIFRMVRYVPTSGTADSATLVTESIVVWDTVSDDGVTVTTTTTSPDSAVAGIIVQAALTPDTLGKTAAQDAGKRNWTWLQTHGLCEVRIAGGVAVGEAMGTSATAGEAEAFKPSTTDSTKNGNAGFFMDDGTTGSDDVECFVMCE